MNLHDELTDVAENALAYGDPDKAVTRARRRRTGRVAAGSLAAVAAIAVAVPIGIQAADGSRGPGGGQAAESTEAPIGVDVVVDGTLRTAGGASYHLDGWKYGTSTVERIPAGWLVTTMNDREDGNSSYLITTDGTRVDLPALDGVGHHELSADGTRIAWESTFRDGDFKAGTIGAEGVTEIGSAPGTEVNSIAGWSGHQVVFFLADERDGSEADQDVSWGTWDPATETFVTEWHEGSPDYANPDGQVLNWTYVGEGPSDDWCMRRSDAATGAVLADRCDLDMALGPINWSPDGEYGLGVSSSPGRSGENVVFTTAELFDAGAQPVPACDLGVVGDAAWIGDTVYATDVNTAEPVVVSACSAEGTDRGTWSFDGTVALVHAYGV